MIPKTQTSSVVDAFGLYTGDFGILLFLFYYSKLFNDKRITSLIDAYLKYSWGKLISNLNSHTFCDGLSGILYLFEFLRENEFIDINLCDVEMHLENYLIREMKKDIQNQHYDFMYGALGTGLYFLKKNKEQPVLELVDYLYDTADKDVANEIFQWKSIIDIKTKQIGYNIALSHGISSIIIFLSRIIKYGMASDKVSEMLHGAINFTLSQEIDFYTWGSYFPSMSKEKTGKSRMGWCYGDLGIAYSLWYAGNMMDKKDWIEKGMNILIDSTKRNSLTDNLVYDAGICHGSSGIAMIFRKMYLNTCMDIFLQASDYWVNKTIAFSNSEDGLAGYRSHTTDGYLNHDFSLLTGVPGVGLMLISYLFKDQQKWDEMFLL